MGDLNGRTGKAEKNQVVGSFGEDTINDNGQRLIQFCNQHDLKILNGFYDHKDIHKYTWRQNTKQLKSIIDYIIIKQRTRWNVHDTRAYRGIECGSDHYIVKSKIYIPFNNIQEQKPKDLTETVTQIKYNLNSLYDDSTRSLYQQRLDQKLDENWLSLTTEELHESIISSIKSAAEEALGRENNNKRNNNNKLTWTKELEEQKRVKQDAYKKWLNSNNTDDKENYKQEQSTYKKLIRQNKDITWEKKCKDLDTYLGGTRSSEAWKFVKSLRSDQANKYSVPMINISKWKNHYGKELLEDRPEYKPCSPKKYRIQGVRVEISDRKVFDVIKSLKNKKASGPDGIPAELWKNGTEKLMMMLARMFERCINGEIVPSSWKEAWITPLHKKGPRDNCNNYRCISVTATLSRIYGKILKNLIEDEYTEMEQQAGFRAGRSCVDHIFTINQLTEKRVACDREVHLLYVDLTKAYDTVPINKLWEVLERTSVNATVTKAIQQLYQDSISRIKIGGEISESFAVTKGLRQGCSLSPTLFKIYLDETLKQWRRSCKGMGFPIGDETTLFTLHFADDQIVIAQEKEDLEYLARKLFDEYKRWGLQVNMLKTKYMCIGGDNSDLILNDGQTIDACEEYVYLGTKMHKTGRTEKEIEERINKGKKLIGAINSTLWSTSISKNRKHDLYNVLLKSIVLYGCETWQLTKRLEERLLALEMDFWRRAAGISKIERIRNEDIRKIMNVKTTIMDEIRQKQLCWYGHVQRMTDERIPKQIMNWTATERRKRGRPKKTWIKGIQKAMSENNLYPGDWNDRRYWKLGTGRRRTL